LAVFGGGAGVGKDFFFEKKKQKTFATGGVAMCVRLVAAVAAARGKSLFASLSEDKRSLLPSGGRLTARSRGGVGCTDARSRR
jgi:hypothetical protein